MPTKLPWYVHPAWPALALLCGAGLERLARGAGRGPRLPPVLALPCLAGAWHVSPFGADPNPPLLAALLGLAVAFPAAALLWRRDGVRGAGLLVGAAWLALLLFAVSGRSVWELNEDYPVAPVAAAVRAHVPPGAAPYTTHPRHRPSLDFAAGRPARPRPVETLRDPAALPGSHWIADAAHLEGVEATVLAEIGPLRLVRKAGGPARP